VFEKVLIANRGEIACRIISTCRRMGIASVAVYSDADVQGRHVRLANEAHRIGPAAARESYLHIDRILQAARVSGAQAIHPGYGFLSENPQFAQRVAEIGLSFIGPPVAAMQAMSSKATARELMLRAGVPVLPGYHGERQELAWLRSQARQIGYPVLIKAVGGGGGKGMRVVDEDAAFAANLAACQREAQASFADARVLLEKYLPAPRHIEVQIFGDRAGQIVHLFERDCSAQRRHQKVIEEARAAHLTDEQRSALTRAACEAGAAVGYSGAGTVEFLLDAEGRHYFIEMNTRIQVEHAVTEMIAGVDLVEWQLRVAAGEPLPRAQQAIVAAGHAIEARLYAEQPATGFLPCSGQLRQFDLPEAGEREGFTLRVETGVTRGDVIGIDYDPLLAKLIVHAASRTLALAGLALALAQVRIAGLGNNVLFLRRLLMSPAMQRGSIHTDYIEQHVPQLLGALQGKPTHASCIARVAAALWQLERERQPAGDDALRAGGSPWSLCDGWRLNTALQRTLHFESGGGGDTQSVSVEYRAAAPWIGTQGMAEPASLMALGANEYTLRLGESAHRLQIVPDADWLQVGIGLEQFRLRWRNPLDIALTASADAASLTAPMPGRIVALPVRAGERVARGTALVVMEAMKMEHTVCAPEQGVVRGYRVREGEQVQEGALLVDFEPVGPAPQA
jgi:3-methylcrotonyl-CoA carboxylase alpha subunit